MKYNFDEPINRMDTHSYKWDLLGEDYLPLWVADMDFAAPPAVTARLQRRLDHGVYGYLLTGREIYDAIRDWFSRTYRVDVPGKEWVRLVPGIVPGLAVASHIGGGKSIAMTPNYCNLLEAPGSAGNEMLTVPLKKELRANEAGKEMEYYSMDLDAVEKALTPDTKLLYLCNPHNPVGRVYTLGELKAVSAFAQKHDLIVVSDEAHCELVFEGEHIPFFAVDEYAREHSITFYSNGKMCNLPDLILAFAVIPNEEIRREFSRLSYAFGEEHVLNVEAGVASYMECDDWKQELLEYLRANRDYLESEIARRFPLAKMPHLEATYLQWVDFSAYGACDASFFRREAKVFLTDGADFGGSGYVRINFGTRRALLEGALQRMEEAVHRVAKAQQ